jgi:hypothetical protein
LPFWPELGPVVGHERVEVELTARGEDVRAQRGRALRARPHVDDRVLLPARVGVDVGDAAPQVDDLPSARDHRHRRAHFAAFAEVLHELVAHALEARVPDARDRAVRGLAVEVAVLPLAVRGAGNPAEQRRGDRARSGAEHEPAAGQVHGGAVVAARGGVGAGVVRFHGSLRVGSRCETILVFVSCETFD